MASPRPRFRVIKGKFASAYMPSNYQHHTEELVARLQSIPMETTDLPLSVNITVLVTKPKTSKLTFPKPDTDNYAKTVLDAVTKAGNIWHDDTQVIDLHVTKLFAAEGLEAGYGVNIKPYQYPA